MEVKSEASASFPAAAAGQFDLLDMLAEVASQELQNEGRGIPAPSSKVPPKSKPGNHRSKRKSLADYDSFDVAQVKRMSQVSLLKLFAEQVGIRANVVELTSHLILDNFNAIIHTTESLTKVFRGVVFQPCRFLGGRRRDAQDVRLPLPPAPGKLRLSQPELRERGQGEGRHEAAPRRARRGHVRRGRAEGGVRRGAEEEESTGDCRGGQQRHREGGAGSWDAAADEATGASATAAAGSSCLSETGTK